MLGFHWKSNGMWLVAARKVNGSHGSTNHSGIFAKLHMDFKATASIGWVMTEPDVRAMFTEIGCIMEDASLIALFP